MSQYEYSTDNGLFAQIANNKIIGQGWGVLIKLQVNAPDPKAFLL